MFMKIIWSSGFIDNERVHVCINIIWVHTPIWVILKYLIFCWHFCVTNPVRQTGWQYAQKTSHTKYDIIFLDQILFRHSQILFSELSESVRGYHSRCLHTLLNLHSLTWPSPDIPGAVFMKYLWLLFPIFSMIYLVPHLKVNARKRTHIYIVINPILIIYSKKVIWLIWQ